MATATAYSKLLEPINIGGVEIRNRVAMGAMGNFGLTNTDGSCGVSTISSSGREGAWA
jgi:2,4-dienoyl-CoA reductase-like NADH-dependent reductase (Old Yellow Enzyme family)